MPLNNKQKLLAYRRLERELIRVFRHFNGLCQACFDLSLAAIQNNQRIDPDELCCCLVDNQVQDHWIFVDEAQRLMNGPGWNKCLAQKNSDWLATGKRRLRGNGPCPALTPHGCALKSFRPPTCSTQLCTKMLRILNDLGIVQGPTAAPRQIEEFAGITSPLNALFSINKKEVSQKEIDDFLRLLRNFDGRCLDVPSAKWQAVIEKEKKKMN